jgi:hypothetical protein
MKPNASIQEKMWHFEKTIRFEVTDAHVDTYFFKQEIPDFTYIIVLHFVIIIIYYKIK